MSNQVAFHQHLDVCAQCRNNPFKLCPVGHLLLTGQCTDSRKREQQCNA